MIHVKGLTLPEAYHELLDKLIWEGEVVYNPDWLSDFIESPFIMEVECPLVEPMISKCFFGTPYDLERYRMEMLDGILDFEVDAGKWTYTYHQRIAKQIPYVIEELGRNRTSRRAVISIWDPEVDKDISDPPCLQHIQYHIFGNRLHCHVLFRSNDIPKALFMNAFALIMLQKWIADLLNLEMGTYIHAANNGHAYKSDWGMLKSFEKRYNAYEILTYSYEGDWKDQMEDARKDILAEVEELRARNGLKTETLHSTTGEIKEDS